MESHSADAGYKVDFSGCRRTTTARSAFVFASQFPNDDGLNWVEYEEVARAGPEIGLRQAILHGWLMGAARTSTIG